MSYDQLRQLKMYEPAATLYGEAIMVEIEGPHYPDKCYFDVADVYNQFPGAWGAYAATDAASSAYAAFRESLDAAQESARDATRD